MDSSNLIQMQQMQTPNPVSQAVYQPAFAAVPTSQGALLASPGTTAGATTVKVLRLCLSRLRV